MNKPVYLRLSVLELNKILMYDFWYDYVKPKYGEKAKLCCINTDSFIVYIKTDDIFKDIADVEKIKKGIEVMKDELGGKIMIKFVELREKTYSYLIADGSEDKKAKGTKKCVIKRKLKFENCKNCFEATQLENKINYLEKKIDIDSFFCYKRKHKEFIKTNKSILKTQQRFRNEKHNVFTEEINKITLSLL